MIRSRTLNPTLGATDDDPAVSPLPGSWAARHRHKMCDKANFMFLLLVLFLLQGLFVGCSQPGTSPLATPQLETSIKYRNTEYGFSFLLPSSWKGYSVITDRWQGYTSGSPQGDVIVEQGPMISIRHPQWTSENPRQDIPIKIFTLDQWNSLQKGNFFVSPAPIGPKELGHNLKYVFALPARYNYTFSTGYREVESILEGNPLHTP